MSKVSYANLKLKTKVDVNTFEFEGQTIEVINYLPVEDKYDLVMITLQQAEEDGIYNSLKLDFHFHLNLVYMYSNLQFTDKQKENEAKIYDCLVSNGFMEQFLATLNQEEYDELLEHIETMIDNNMVYKNTAGAVLQKVIQDLPKNAQIASEIIDNFDENKWENVKRFAAAANGGRDIVTNQ